MNTISKQCENTLIINKSKFISFVFPLKDEKECKDILASLSEKYNDATHICYAYVLSSPRVEKCSDNGEPSGTAGKPILEVLKKKALEDVLCVVVRYFGGKKLGAGGLIRAYSNSASEAISLGQIVEKKFMIKQVVVCDIKDGDKIKRIIESKGGNIAKIDYGNNITIHFEASEKLDICGYLIEEE